METHVPLQQRLDAYVAGTCTPSALTADLLAHCAAAPRAAWEVLALLDQYHRRGKLPQALHRSISQSIERRALGVHSGGLGKLGEPGAVTRQPAANQPVMPRVVARSNEGNGLSGELLLLRKELQATRALSAAYLEQLKSQAWPRPAADTAPLASNVLARPASAIASRRTTLRWPARSVQAVSVIVFMLAVGASQGLGEREEALPRPVLAAPVPAHVAVPGQLSLMADTFIVQPGSHSAPIVVRRAGGSDGPISFTWWTQNAGAKAGADFRAQAARRVTMPDGAQQLELSVPILDNPARRHTELFYVAIGSPQGGATLGENRRAAVFIMRP